MAHGRLGAYKAAMGAALLAGCAAGRPRSRAPRARAAWAMAPTWSYAGVGLPTAPPLFRGGFGARTWTSWRMNGVPAGKHEVAAVIDRELRRVSVEVPRRP